MNRWLLSFLLFLAILLHACVAELGPSTPTPRAPPVWCYRVILRPEPRCFPSPEVCEANERQHDHESFSGCRAYRDGYR